MKRVVTGHDESGRSVVLSEGDSPRELEPLPGWKLIELWATDEVPRIPAEDREPLATLTSLTPGIAGTRFRIFTVPPGNDERDPESRARLQAGILAARDQLPGLGEHLEIDDPGMHTTDTVDYIVVLSGEAELELDDGATVYLAPGDCVIQQGTRHAWRNRGDLPFVAAAIMIGAARQGQP